MIKQIRPRGSPPSMQYDEVPCAKPNLDSNCFVFRGHKDRRGYGRVYNRGGTSLAHKYAWELVYGPVPDGLELDHQCMNKACINLYHLRTVSHKVNSTENVEGANWQINLAKTHCPRGHKYTIENTRIRYGGHGRECKTCARINKQARKKRKRLEARLAKGANSERRSIISPSLVVWK